ncbi:hypothetical protein C7475_11255 [Chitinophaga sp. S165]|nr:hypothetical protein C7475_11255 [Chitinophaga sp. S165]
MERRFVKWYTDAFRWIIFLLRGIRPIETAQMLFRTYVQVKENINISQPAAKPADKLLFICQSDRQRGFSYHYLVTFDVLNRFH